MGLLQKAVETYDANRQYVGKEREGHAILAPISHVITAASIEITISSDGEFITARKIDKSEPKIIIPVTEKSAGRTAASCPHPLCDQLCYVAPYSEEKNTLYISQLGMWANSEFAHPIVKAVYRYVTKATVISDLEKTVDLEPDEQGSFKNEKDLIRWRVLNDDGYEPRCWLNTDLFDAFINWNLTSMANVNKDICMVSGEESIIAEQHPKGIIALNGNAKLISSNDNQNFTYRGRFQSSEQAATIGYISSQKAHNALRWLAAEQGVSISAGGRTFLCWNPAGKKVVHPALPFLRRGEMANEPTEYKTALKNSLAGYKTELPENCGGIVIAAFDAATTGRLALTYYSEFMASDFLERLHYWDEYCCWWAWNFENRCFTIQSPSLYSIAVYAYGTERNGKMEIEDRVLKQQIQRLISCRIEKAIIPFDIVMQLVTRVSLPQAFEKNYSALLSVACSVIRKYHFDKYKEVLEMDLEKDRIDRSYQFGRLLAILEKAEKDSYGKEESRTTNAEKMHSSFVRHPLHTATIINSQLERAYFRHLSEGSVFYYKKLMGEIFEKIYTFPEGEWNKPLDDTYLVGYYLQRNAFYKPKEEKKEE